MSLNSNLMRPGKSHSISFSGSSTSINVSTGVYAVRILSESKICRVNIGAEDATAGSMIISGSLTPNGLSNSDIFSVSGGEKISVIQDSVTGIVNIVEMS